MRMRQPWDLQSCGSIIDIISTPWLDIDLKQTMSSAHGLNNQKLHLRDFQLHNSCPQQNGIENNEH